MRQWSLLPVGMFLAVSCLFAESGSPDSIQVKYTLNPIVKIATKTAGAQRDLAASITVLEQSDIENGLTSQVFELVAQRVPGLYVTEWGIMGFGVAGKAAGKISVRGMGGGANTHVLILRNGRPDFMGLMGCTIADEFDTQGIERIEIIRGPGSFLYGTNATGGVINIVSRQRQSAGFETRIETGDGEFQSRRLAVSHGGKSGPFDYYITGSRNSTAGHRQDANAAYAGNHYTMHLGSALSPGTRLELNMTLADISLNDPGLLNDPKENDWYDFTRYGGDITLTHFSRLGETQVKLHGNFGHHDFFDGWKSDDRLTGLMVYQTLIPWNGSTITTGLDWKEYGGDALDSSTDYEPRYITEFAPYLHMQQLLGARYIAIGGMRFEHHELFGWEILPKAGLVFHVSPQNAVRLSVSRGFRSPSIRELYFWMPANDALTPDRVLDYELGVSHEFKGRARLELVMFTAEGSNLIQFSGPPPKWVNSGAYTHRGVELMGDVMIASGLSVSSAFTLMDLSEEIYNVPKQKFTVQARYKWNRFTLSSSLLSVHDWKSAVFTGSSPIPVLYTMKDYTVLHGAVHARVYRGLSAKMTLKNLFNADYQSMAGYPMPGRTWMGTLIYDF